MIENTILCVKWGDKYDSSFIEKLKEQIKRNCSIPFNFYCLTDKPEKEYDIQLPIHWDKYYNSDTNRFWAYRKCYMFDMEKNFPEVKGTKYLYLDLDILIHQDLKCFFDLSMDKPYIVRGWWNDSENCKKNFGKIKSTPLNSSVIRWNKEQLLNVYGHIERNKEVIFFTYHTIDNYFNHFWYNIWEEDKSYFRGYPKGWIYSWYKGNIFNEDMEFKKIRQDHKICLFNNSSSDNYDANEIKELWSSI